MTTEFEKYERISAFLDGESDAPEDDAQLLDDNDALKTVHRQYARIGRLTRSLSAPTPSTHFLANTLARLPESEHAGGKRWRRLAAAAALLAALLLTSYLIGSGPGSRTPHVGPIASFEAEVTERSDMPWLDGSAAMLDTLALFEAIPTDDLLEALAVIAFDAHHHHASSADVGFASHAPLHWDEYWSLGTPGDFMEMYFWIETLDEADADALNEILRDALAQH